MSSSNIYYCMIYPFYFYCYYDFVAYTSSIIHVVELNPIREEENGVSTIVLPAWLSNKSFYQLGLSKSKKRIKLK